MKGYLLEDGRVVARKPRFWKGVQTLNFLEGLETDQDHPKKRQAEIVSNLKKAKELAQGPNNSALIDRINKSLESFE